MTEIKIFTTKTFFSSNLKRFVERERLDFSHCNLFFLFRSALLNSHCNCINGRQTFQRISPNHGDAIHLSSKEMYKKRFPFFIWLVHQSNYHLLINISIYSLQKIQSRHIWISKTYFCTAH